MTSELPSDPGHWEKQLQQSGLPAELPLEKFGLPGQDELVDVTSLDEADLPLSRLGQPEAVESPALSLGLEPEVLVAAVPGLNERQAYVLVERLYGKTLEEVGLGLGVTRERVRQIESSALAKMRAQYRYDLREPDSPNLNPDQRRLRAIEFYLPTYARKLRLLTNQLAPYTNTPEDHHTGRHTEMFASRQIMATVDKLLEKYGLAVSPRRKQGYLSVMLRDLIHDTADLRLQIYQEFYEPETDTPLQLRIVAITQLVIDQYVQPKLQSLLHWPDPWQILDQQQDPKWEALRLEELTWWQEQVVWLKGHLAIQSRLNESYLTNYLQTMGGPGQQYVLLIEMLNNLVVFRERRGPVAVPSLTNLRTRELGPAQTY